jgi:uncharacterized protein YerC
MEKQDFAILIKAIKTHRRKHDLLFIRANAGKGKYKFSKNAEKLKEKHLNEVKSCDAFMAKIIADANLKRRKSPKFLNISELIKIKELIKNGDKSLKSIAIDFGVSYETISRIKCDLGLGRSYKKDK